MKTMTDTMSEIIKESKYKITFFGKDFLVLIINSILGGFFIALSGFVFQKTMRYTNGNVLASSLMLPLGFLLCDAFWSDIFSNNFLYSMAAYEKKIDWKSFIVSTILITFFNILGIILFIACVYLAGSLLDIQDIALHEIEMKSLSGYLPSLFEGILGSVCICVGSFMARRTESIWEKTTVIFVAVFIMSLCGFEHATVDLYLFLVCPTFKALYYIPHLVLVYIGNIIGGLVFSGLFSLEIDIEDNEIEE